jgi:hypothetical protein
MHTHTHVHTHIIHTRACTHTHTCQVRESEAKVGCTALSEHAYVYAFSRRDIHLQEQVF